MLTARLLTTEGAKSMVRAHLARAVAAALITGIDNAEQEGHELTQLQQIDLATMSVMAYQEEVASAESSIDVEAALFAARR